MFFFRRQRRHLNILRVYRIHLRINIWTGRIIIKLNHYKSMLPTMHTMFVNAKIKRIYSFCPFSTWNTRQIHFNRSIVTKTSHLHEPPKILHSVVNCKTCSNPLKGLSGTVVGDYINKKMNKTLNFRLCQADKQHGYWIHINIEVKRSWKRCWLIDWLLVNLKFKKILLTIKTK